MQRWFLSYNSRDYALVDSLQNALRRKDPEARIFFAPKSLRAGGYLAAGARQRNRRGYGIRSDGRREWPRSLAGHGIL